MVKFLSIIFFLFLQFLLVFSNVPVFLCHPVRYVACNIHIISQSNFNFFLCILNTDPTLTKNGGTFYSSENYQMVPTLKGKLERGSNFGK